MRQKISLLLILCLLSFSAACSWGLQRKLVGRWANKYSSSAWDLKSDGTIDVLQKDPSGGDRAVATGSYKVKDSETIEIRWSDSPAKSDLIKVRFNPTGDMVLTLPDRSQRVFVKVT